MGASLALAGVSGGCTKMPNEKIYQYPLAQQSGADRLHFASSSLFRGYAKGIVVTSHQGRPTKIEGNELHPASNGSTDIFSQAEILELYDPQRSQAVIHRGEIGTWSDLQKEIEARSPGWKEKQGAGIHFLSATVTSPLLMHQFKLFLNQYPRAVWHCYQPINGDSIKAGSELAFGNNLRPLYHFDKARIVVSMDADFLGPGIAQQAYARAFMRMRNMRDEQKIFNRLYVIESSRSITGSIADHRLALKPSMMIGFSAALARKLGMAVEAPQWAEQYHEEIECIARDLVHNAPASMVVAGEEQPPELHALCHAINHRLGNFGTTVTFIEPPEANKDAQAESLTDLCKKLEQDQVDALIIIGANPAYATPPQLTFAELMKRAQLTIHLGLYENETSKRCDWHLPESHFLETFGDARAFDGTVSFMQPLIDKLYDSRAATELIAMLRQDKTATTYELLKNYWSEQKLSSADFEQSLHDGVVAGSQSRKIRPIVTEGWQSRITAQHKKNATLEVLFRADSTILDGQYAHNAWLQELPKPIVQLCWDNAAFLSPATAKKLSLSNEDKITLAIDARNVDAPVFIVPGHADDCVTVNFGYGRSRAGIGSHRGFNAYELFELNKYYATDLQITKLTSTWKLANVDRHHTMAGRSIVRRGSWHNYQKNPSSIIPPEAHAPQTSLLPKRKGGQYAWAMVIDLNSCIGCNTCTIACQAENNIPVVGKEQVRNARQMHWIRVDRYFEGPPENPQTYFQPVPCMHCENAPCELVCPTAATNHSVEGVNQMVYNRCVGTRYCSNNCPYKVRRFNFLQYSDTKTASLRLMYNPDVTLRTRGVMEKCTYCVQRIEDKRIRAAKENRNIRDGEIIPACAQACPTNAIVFGDKQQPSTQVAKLAQHPLNYSLLHELGTRPRTTYLAKLANQNARWQKEET